MFLNVGNLYNLWNSLFNTGRGQEYTMYALFDRSTKDYESIWERIRKNSSFIFNHCTNLQALWSEMFILWNDKHV